MNPPDRRRKSLATIDFYSSFHVLWRRNLQREGVRLARTLAAESHMVGPLHQWPPTA
jgi:hypothetical protein